MGDWTPASGSVGDVGEAPKGFEVAREVVEEMRLIGTDRPNAPGDRLLDASPEEGHLTGAFSPSERSAPPPSGPAEGARGRKRGRGERMPSVRSTRGRKYLRGRKRWRSEAR